MNKSYFAGILTVVTVLIIYVIGDSAVKHSKRYRAIQKENMELRMENDKLKEDTTKYRKELVNHLKAENQSDYQIDNFMIELCK